MMIESGPKVSKRNRLYKPLPPAFKYFGGKSRERKFIIPVIPDHEIFTEPFAGGASVTLGKAPSETEVLGDKRADVINFWRRIKSGKPIHPIRKISKQQFLEIREKPEEQRTPEEFLELQANSFGGHGESYASGSSSTAKKLIENFDAYWLRLRKTILRESDFRDTIRQYNSPETCHYIDPPFMNDLGKYVNYGGHGIPSLKDLRDTTDRINGKFILSLPDTPEVRKAFPQSDFHIEVLTLYRPLTSYNKGPHMRTELLITNFNPSRANRWWALEDTKG